MTRRYYFFCLLRYSSCEVLLHYDRQIIYKLIYNHVSYLELDIDDAFIVKYVRINLMCQVFVLHFHLLI
jgi:hypothetical protein